MIVPEGKTNEKFKELGQSAFMVNAKIGLAMVEVIRRAKRMKRVHRKWGKNPNSNISDLLREIASVCAALDDLERAEAK